MLARVLDCLKRSLPCLLKNKIFQWLCCNGCHIKLLSSKKSRVPIHHSKLFVQISQYRVNWMHLSSSCWRWRQRQRASPTRFDFLSLHVIFIVNSQSHRVLGWHPLFFGWNENVQQRYKNNTKIIVGAVRVRIKASVKIACRSIKTPNSCLFWPVLWL